MTRKYFNICIFFLAGVLLFGGCQKGSDSSATPTPTPTPTTPTTTVKTCIISGVSQRNSGAKAEFAITVSYDANLSTTKISVYDSASNANIYSTSFTYAAADSIRLDQYEYMKLDANKRVVLFITKSDMSDPVNSDNYRYEYIYNTGGYLITKNLYVNGSAIANYATSYTYTNNLLTSCIMSAPSSGGLKVLDATLTYDVTLSPKTMIYTFPDAFESYYFTAALNFGSRPANPLTRVVTRLYNPGSGALLDTWTTNYSGYTIDANGYLSAGTAAGDLQQGMASFYGKTYFTYQCQ